MAGEWPRFLRRFLPLRKPCRPPRHTCYLHRTPFPLLVTHPHGPDEALLTPEWVEQTTRTWLLRHAEEPLRQALLAHLDHHPLKVETGTTEAGDLERLAWPHNRLSLLCYSEPGSPEEARYRRCNGLLRITARGILRQPYVGYWCAQAAARACALALEGVVFNAETPRPLPLPLLNQPLPSEGRLAATDCVQASSHAKQDGWLLRTSMCWNLSLPEFHWRAVQTTLRPAAGAVLLGVLQLLIEWANTSWPPDATEAFVPLQEPLRIDSALLRRAFGLSPFPDSDALQDQPLEIGLHTTSPCHGGFWLDLVPPGYSGRTLRSYPRKLLPLTAQWNQRIEAQVQALVEKAALPPLTDGTAIATRRAQAELPKAKELFQSGAVNGGELRVWQSAVPGETGRAIRVTRWEGDRLTGRISSFDQEQELTLEEAQVVDWSLSYPDSRALGGFV